MNKIKVESDLKDIMPEFLLILEKEIVLIAEAFGQKELGLVTAFGHRLKGDAPGYGLRDLGLLGMQIEEAGREKNWVRALEIFEKIKLYLETLEIEYL